MKPRNCPICNSTFTTRRNKFCSHRCSEIAQQQDTWPKFEAGFRGELNNTGPIKKYLAQVRGYRCEICGISDWNNQELKLQLHHVDGDPLNNFLENLQLVCPNCHSQTDSYGAKNKGKGRPMRRERYRRVSEATPEQA